MDEAVFKFERLLGVDKSLNHLSNPDPLHYDAFGEVCRSNGRPKKEDVSINVLRIQKIVPDVEVEGAHVYASYVTVREPDESIKEYRLITRTDKDAPNMLSEAIKSTDHKFIRIETTKGNICINPSEKEEIGYAVFAPLRWLFGWYSSRITLIGGERIKSPLSLMEVEKKFPSQNQQSQMPHVGR